LATVGRLTASLAHEINNPMQAIKGAMDLIFEESDDQESVRVYTQLAYRQAARVTDLVERMQRIYRPQGDQPEAVVVNTLLRDTIVDARKEMARQNVKLETDFAGEMRPVWVTAHQLHLVFLNIILHLSLEIGEADGGLLLVRSGEFEEWVRVEFITAVSIPALKNLSNDNPDNTPRQINFGLSFSQDIVQAYDGQLELLLVEDKLVVRIDLPPMNE
jgi:nitrogen-specific signal transduction histidine kinase